MGVFEFILILMVIIVIGEVATKVLPPLAGRAADLLGDVVRERREERAGPPPPGLPPEALEELENRIARIEERLLFLEELKAPEGRRAIEAATRGDDGSSARDRARG